MLFSDALSTFAALLHEVLRLSMSSVGAPFALMILLAMAALNNSSFILLDDVLVDVLSGVL